MSEINITPENTQLDYLINNPEWLQELAEKLSDGNLVSKICDEHGCGECPIYQNNFNSKTFSGGCADVRTQMILIAKTAKAASKTVDKSGKCASCAYFIKQGEYPYCTAWHNFTTKDMYCGYYKAIDK